MPPFHSTSTGARRIAEISSSGVISPWFDAERLPRLGAERRSIFSVRGYTPAAGARSACVS